jgi:hypothetical protein
MTDNMKKKNDTYIRRVTQDTRTKDQRLHLA